MDILQFLNVLGLWLVSLRVLTLKNVVLLRRVNGKLYGVCLQTFCLRMLNSLLREGAQT